MTKIGEEWDHTQYQSRRYDPYSWEDAIDPRNWGIHDRYWGNSGASVAISLNHKKKKRNFEILCTGDGRKGRWSFYTLVQGRYTITRNEPGYLTMRIRGGTDWTAFFSSGETGFFGNRKDYDDPTNLFDLELTITPYIVPAVGGAITSSDVAVCRIRGTTARDFDFSSLTPTGRMTIDTGEQILHKTRENGVVQYGLVFPEGSFGWSPVNKKKGKR